MSLSLNALAGAVGQTQGSNVSLDNCNNAAGTQIAMSDFQIDRISGITGSSFVNGGSAYSGTVGFVNAGTAFNSYIRTRYQNFTFTDTSAFYFFWNSNQDYTAGATTNNPPSDQNITISVKFNDGFNSDAVNYDTTLGKALTIYNVIS